MSAFKRRLVFAAGVVLLILFWAIAVGPEPPARISISPEELVRAVTIQRDSLIDLYLMEQVDPNGRDAQGRTPLLIAMSQQDWKTARRLVDAGAQVDLADKSGFTPFTAAAMHGDLAMFQLLLARSTNLHAEAQTKDGQDLLGLALDGGNPEIIKTVIERLPPMPEWKTSTRRALTVALQAQNKEQIRSLLRKHSTPPTPEGRSVPFLAYSIAGNNSSLFSTLLACGADPNTVLPSRCDKDFLALLSSKGLRSYVEDFVKMMKIENSIIMGNSLGGHVGLLYTLHNPAKVTKLILTGSSGLFENAMGGSYPRRGSYDYIRERVEYTFFDPKTASKDLVDEVFETTKSIPKAMRIVAIAKSAQRNNLSEELHNIKVPTLLVWGLNDTITPTMVAHDFNRLIPVSQLKFIDSCGHAPMMEHPERFNELVEDFLGTSK